MFVIFLFLILHIMKNLTKVIMIFVILVWLVFSNYIVTANYEKPIAPSWLSTDILNSANTILDTVYNKRTNATKYPTEQSYIAYLDRVIGALNALKSNFSSTDTRFILVTYLSSWLTNIKISIINDTNLLNSITNIINDWNSTTSPWTSTWNCLLNTNDLIWWEKYIDTNNFTLISGNEISVKFYLLNWVYKKLSVKCNNWVTSINNNVTTIYTCNQWYSATNWVCNPLPIWYYSTSSGNLTLACTNKPTNSTYTSAWIWINNCTWWCNTGYTQSWSTCIINCTSNSSYSCYSGNLYWYDSCGKIWSLKLSCSNWCSWNSCTTPSNCGTLNNKYWCAGQGAWTLVFSGNFGYTSASQCQDKCNSYWTSVGCCEWIGNPSHIGYWYCLGRKWKLGYATYDFLWSYRATTCQ